MSRIGGGETDFIRQQRDFSDHEQRITALEATAGDPLSGSSFPGSVFRTAIVAETGDIVADTNATHSSGATLTVPQANIEIGGRIDVRICVSCVVNAFPWSFRLELFDGTNSYPMHDVVAPSDPGDPDIVIDATYTAGFWLNGSSLELAGTGSAAYFAAAGTTPPLGGVATLGDFAPPLRTLFADMDLTPRITVTGAAVGNTFNLRRFEVLVHNQTS
jgi:hypothetical protein